MIIDAIEDLGFVIQDVSDKEIRVIPDVNISADSAIILMLDNENPGPRFSINYDINDCGKFRVDCEQESAYEERYGQSMVEAAIVLQEWLRGMSDADKMQLVAKLKKKLDRGKFQDVDTSGSFSAALKGVLYEKK